MMVARTAERVQAVHGGRASTSKTHFVSAQISTYYDLLTARPGAAVGK